MGDSKYMVNSSRCNPRTFGPLKWKMALSWSQNSSIINTSVCYSPFSSMIRRWRPESTSSSKTAQATPRKTRHSSSWLETSSVKHQRLLTSKSSTTIPLSNYFGMGRTTTLKLPPASFTPDSWINSSTTFLKIPKISSRASSGETTSSKVSKSTMRSKNTRILILVKSCQFDHLSDEFIINSFNTN